MVTSPETLLSSAGAPANSTAVAPEADRKMKSMEKSAIIPMETTREQSADEAKEEVKVNKRRDRARRAEGARLDSASESASTSVRSVNQPDAAMSVAASSSAFEMPEHPTREAPPHLVPLNDHPHSPVRGREEVETGRKKNKKTKKLSNDKTVSVRAERVATTAAEVGHCLAGAVEAEITRHQEPRSMTVTKSGSGVDDTPGSDEQNHQWSGKREMSDSTTRAVEERVRVGGGTVRFNLSATLDEAHITHDVTGTHDEHAAHYVNATNASDATDGFGSIHSGVGFRGMDDAHVHDDGTSLHVALGTWKSRLQKRGGDRGRVRGLVDMTARAHRGAKNRDTSVAALTHTQG